MTLNNFYRFRKFVRRLLNWHVTVKAKGYPKVPWDNYD